MASLAAACGSDAGSAGDGGTSTTVISLPKGTVSRVLCKEEATEDLAVPTGIDVLVTNLIRQASLTEATPYEDYALRCDNAGVTTIEVPTAYRDVGPSPLDQRQAAVRASTDFEAPVETAPIITFLTATVGGTQFPTQPGFTGFIQQSADGSLSSGTRDPRDGAAISEDCEALPVRELATGEFTGKAQFFVNCGGEERAWVLVAASPNNGDPYFVQLLAQARDAADAEAIGRALSTMGVDSEALAAFTAGLTPAAPAGSEQPATTLAPGATPSAPAPTVTP